MTRAGFIGLGSQGAPMARRITEAGLPLTVWARREASLEPFGDTEARIAPTPAELAAASDIVGVCVVADDDVKDVLLRPDGVLAGMSPGGLIAVHSTISPKTCRHLSDVASAQDVAVIDAPVSGGGHKAAAGELLVMAGGADADVERGRPVFETFAKRVLHLGPVGSGQVAKLLNNLVFTAQIAAAVETFDFAASLDVDRTALAAVLADGSGGSTAASILAGLEFDLAGPRSAVDLLRKDVGLMLDVARDAAVPEPDGLLSFANRTFELLGGSTDPPAGSKAGPAPERTAGGGG
jgi:3-hydroxyisobutyrate dehydrogenase-like beta-hydroxyacid dehydrogenase